MNAESNGGDGKDESLLNIKTLVPTMNIFSSRALSRENTAEKNINHSEFKSIDRSRTNIQREISVRSKYSKLWDNI